MRLSRSQGAYELSWEYVSGKAIFAAIQIGNREAYVSHLVEVDCFGGRPIHDFSPIHLGNIYVIAVQAFNNTDMPKAAILPNDQGICLCITWGGADAPFGA